MNLLRTLTHQGFSLPDNFMSMKKFQNLDAYHNNQGSNFEQNTQNGNEGGEDIMMSE